MVDKYCLDDVPERVLDVLKTFLAASYRGEKAVLVLETQQKMVTTKYRSVETRPGSPVTCADTTKKRRKTPARARRSQLRLEVFRKKKLEEKNNLETVNSSAAGESSSSSASRVVIELTKKEGEVGAGLSCPVSPIVQLDGIDEFEENVNKFSFESTFHEDDITELLSEIFPEVNITLESRVKVAPRSAREIFVIALKSKEQEKLYWPDMKEDHGDVFQDVKRLNK